MRMKIPVAFLKNDPIVFLDENLEFSLGKYGLKVGDKIGIPSFLQNRRISETENFIKETFNCLLEASDTIGFVYTYTVKGKEDEIQSL